MREIFEEAKRLLEKGEPFVLATVVGTKGSTPQKPGAKFLVRRDGTAVGTLGGGCIEADVWAEAKVILEEKRGTQLRQFVLNEDIAARDGLVCGGTMEILIDPMGEQPQMLSLFDEILMAYDGRGDRALATLANPGPDNGACGAKLFIRADGSTVRTLGDPKLDARSIDVALELMPTGREGWVKSEEGAKVYLETFTTPATVVIAGGGHVGKALYTVAKFLGFRVVIVDDRPMYANKERFPDADEIIVEDFAVGLRNLKMTPNCYVIVATRGHKLDDLALIEAAKSRAGYVGLLGSKRKAILIYRDMIRQGIPEERIREIRAPVGLNLGGRNPEEIAISIMAEILAVKCGGDGSSMTMDRKMLDKAKQLVAKSRK